MTIFFLKTHISNVFSIGKSTQNQYTKANPDTHNQYIGYINIYFYCSPGLCYPIGRYVDTYAIYHGGFWQHLYLWIRRRQL